MNRSELSPGFVVEEADDDDTEEIVMSSSKVAKALYAVRQASAEIHAAAQALPMRICLELNTMATQLAAIEYRLEEIDRDA